MDLDKARQLLADNRTLHKEHIRAGAELVVPEVIGALFFGISARGNIAFGNDKDNAVPITNERLIEIADLVYGSI